MKKAIQTEATQQDAGVEQHYGSAEGEEPAPELERGSSRRRSSRLPASEL